MGAGSVRGPPSLSSGSVLGVCYSSRVKWGARARGVWARAAVGIWCESLPLRALSKGTESL